MKATKRLSIFDLKEGKIYRAFNANGGEIGRKFRVAKGELQNNTGEAFTGQYVGCSWVPVNAGVTFEEEGDSDVQVGLLSLQPGTVYESSKTGRIARKGTTLFIVDDKNRMSKKLDLKQISLSTLFMAVGKIAMKRKAAKAKSKSRKARR